jgi:hypothetical protein
VGNFLAGDRRNRRLNCARGTPGAIPWVSAILHLDAVRSQHRRDSLRVVGSDDRLDPLTDVNEQRDSFVTASQVEVEPAGPSAGPYLRITSTSAEHAIKPSSYSKSLVAPAIRYSFDTSIVRR